MEQQAPRSGASPWLIGCGILLALVVLGGGGGLYFWYQSAVITEPAKVVEHAAKILPGAEPQPGMVGIWGMDTFGLRLAVMGPPESDASEQDVYSTAVKGMAIVLVGLPKDAESKGNTNIDTVPNNAEFKKTGDEKHTVGGIEVTFEVGELQEADGPKMRQMRGELTKSDGRRVHISIIGPAEKFETKVVADFFAGIKPLNK